MPAIAHVASLWSLRGHPDPRREWSLETKIRAIAAAGFDGIAALLTADHRRLAEKHGLRHLVGFISSADPREFASLIRQQKLHGAVQINVQMDDHDTPPIVATRHWLRMVRDAERIGGVNVSLEIHRDCCTETPEKTYEIAERFHLLTDQTIKLTLDFSHFAVVKHLVPSNYAERLLQYPELIQNTEQCHFRPFNGHHCQVPVTRRKGLTPEVKSYLLFVSALLKLWLSHPGNRNKTLFACPEIGPFGADGGGYNITGFPPAWPEAVVLRNQVARRWRGQLLRPAVRQGPAVAAGTYSPK